jgi:hypothetical protein
VAAFLGVGEMLIDAIREHALAAAESGDFAAVATALQAIAVTAEPRACFGVESAEAIDGAGGRRRAIMAAMSQDPDGMFVLTKLASTGVVWAHQMTVALMDGLILAGVMHTADKTALVQLSAPVRHPYASITADDCHRAWIVASCIDPITAARSAAATKLNNAQASLGPEHTDGLTLEDLQARCEAITASQDGTV